MKTHSKSQSQINKEVEKTHKEIQPALYEYNPKGTEKITETEANLNEKILKITTEIKEKHPELTRFLNDKPVTIPYEENPEITLNNLRTHYDLLTSMLNKHIS